MTIKSYWRSGFWIGFLMHALINYMYQDWIGLDAYIAMILDLWVDIHWAVWVIPILICLDFYQNPVHLSALLKTLRIW